MLLKWRSGGVLDCRRGGELPSARPAAVPFCPPFARSVITEGIVVVKSEVVNGKFRDIEHFHENCSRTETDRTASSPRSSPPEEEREEIRFGYIIF
jgi:hypothetical protein